MKFEDLKITDAVKQVPTVNIELDDYDYDDEKEKTIRFSRNEFHLTECKDFNIMCKLHVTEEMDVNTATNIDPEEMTVSGTGIWVEDFVLINDESEELKKGNLVTKVYREFIRSINIM